MTNRKRALGLVSMAGVALSMASVLAFAKETTKESPSGELAKVNHKSIMKKDLLETLGALNQTQRDNVLKDINARRQLLQQIIDQEVLAQEAEKLKLDETPEFKQAIASFRRQLLVTNVMARKLEGKGTPKEAKVYYEAHKQDFSRDRVNVQQILVKEENEAKEIAKQAKNTSEDFQVLAEKHSVDPNAKNNRGNVGWIQRGMMAPEFTEAAFNGKEGSIVGPVRTAFGYHVIKVIEKQTFKPLEFDEVELQVQGILREKLSRNIVDQLRAHAQIKVDNSAVDKM